MQNHSDPELVALYLESKDLQYLTELFTRHSDIVYRTALRTMKNPSDAEDIMQAAYIKMISHMHLYKGTGSVLGWMLQMVVYSCYDQLRSEKSRLNRERKIMSERTPMTTPKNEELKEMIDTHLSKLPEIYRAPITLQILEGLSIKEVSEVLQIPEKTIRSQIARGLEKLKVSLQNVGVTASIISVGDMLKEIHQPLAPEIYKSSQYFNSLYQQKALASAKLAVTTSAKGFVVQKVLTIALLVVATISGVFVWKHLEKKSEATSISTILGKKWDFESTKTLAEYQDIGLLNGAIAIEKSMGENQSNGLMVEEKSILELDISKYKMPLKISYKTNYYFPKDTTLYGQMVVKSNYLKDQKVFFFTAVRERIKAEYNSIKGKIELNGNWYSNVFYIDEKSIDYWVEGQRSQVLLGQSSQNKKVYLSIYGKAIIDNLKIESIEENSLPDKSLFEKVALTMEIKEGSSTYSIEKEKLGISKNSTANPQLDIMTAADFEKNFGANPIGVYPSLNKEKNIVWEMAPQKIIQQWDFENTKDLPEYLGIRLVNGGISIKESMGVNNSNALVTSEETLIEFDISKYKLPIKISFDMDMFASANGNAYGPIFVKNNYLKEQNTLLTAGSIKNIKRSNKNGNAKLGYSGEWVKVESFIDEASIDFWMNGVRGHIMHGASRDNKKTYFSLNKAIIDNLKIETIEKELLPNKSVYVDLIESFVYKKDVENYSIEKEKLGFDKNSEATPWLYVIKPEFFVNKLGVNNEVNHPYLSASKKVEWLKSTKKLVKTWAFEDINEMYDFKLIRGLFGYGEGKGVDKSNGVAVEMETFLEIDISKFKLPLKITFSFDCLVSKNQTSKGFLMAKSNYQENKNILFFTQLSPAPVLVSLNEKIINENSKKGFFGIWLPAEIYVSEDGVDQWLYGKRAGLTLGSSKDNKKLYMNFKDKTYFDNFTIESVEPSVVPDISVFKSFAATLPYVKSYKSYYKLDKEKQILNLDENSAAELGICDNIVLEKSFGPDKKAIVKPIGK